MSAPAPVCTLPRLDAVHRQRLALAVDAARRGTRVVFNQEWSGGGLRQFVWYANATPATRAVILSADLSDEFRALVAQARAEFDAMLRAAERAPMGAVLDAGECEDAMEEARR